uniref:Response regulator n=1 Tax=Oscillatoriales cyanobacterium SpSt-418 TaxID=2282169 RepID=A0A7C3PGB8_9CYAN
MFCDVNIPMLNGIEGLKQVRDDENIAHIPFFFLTSEVGLSSNHILWIPRCL